jgi:hypothetical protein
MRKSGLIIAALSSLCAFSQEKKPCPCVTTMVAVGMMGGESAAKPQFQATTGLRSGSLFAGVGAGLDHYYLRSIPVFADLRANLGHKQSAFLYLQGGYNFPYNNHNDILIDIATSVHHYSGGLYFDTGLGYRIHVNTFHRILLSAGYSRKELYDRLVNSYCEIVPCHQDEYKYHFRVGRISARLSWEFGR